MVRQGPSKSATLYTLGTRKRGNDNNMWEIVVNVKGIPRWKKISRKPSKKISRKTSKKKSRKTSRKKSRKISKRKNVLKSRETSKKKSTPSTIVKGLNNSDVKMVFKLIKHLGADYNKSIMNNWLKKNNKSEKEIAKIHTKLFMKLRQKLAKYRDDEVSKYYSQDDIEYDYFWVFGGSGSDDILWFFVGFLMTLGLDEYISLLKMSKKEIIRTFKNNKKKYYHFGNGVWHVKQQIPTIVAFDQLD